MESTIEQTENFLKISFQENPSYSFNDWIIMYEHSLKVRDFALKIAESVECNKELLTIEALLHDIGKCCKASSKTLREHHAELGYDVAKEFVSQLNLPEEVKNNLVMFLKGQLDSVEGQVVKDADIIAFLSDEKLQNALKIWADKENLPGELQKKLNKINNLKFDVSKEIALPFFESMRERWNLK